LAPDPTKTDAVTYADAGVNIDRANRTKQRIKYLAHKTFTKGVLSEIGGFGGLFSIAKTYLDPVLVSSVDGVGTKLKVAFEMNVHHTVGADLVNHCVNDIAVQGAAPLFFMDYLATGKLEPEVTEKIIEGLAEACKHNGCALIGGETAEMPGLYKGGDYDLAGFSVGAVERDALLPRGVAAGDVVLGLASSGLHSNGYSLARKVVEQSGLKWEAPCPFASMTLGEAMLAPTRIYVRSCLAAIRETGGVKALAHITGGGFPDNIPRVLPKNVGARIDISRIAVPPVFQWLARTGGIAEKEMLRTFNCGIGMIFVVEARAADKVAAILKREGESIVHLGELVVATKGKPRVTYTGRLNV